MKYKFKNQREKQLAIMVMLLVVGSLGYFGIYETLVDSFNGMNEEISNLQAKLVTMRRTERNRSHIGDDYERITHELRIPGSETQQQRDIQSDINELLYNAGMNPKSQKPQAVKREEDFKVFYFDISEIKTTTLQLLTFLDLLETKYRLLEVDKLNIDRPPRPRNAPLFDVPITVHMKMSRLVYTKEEKN